jgi:Trypsin-co-occurring domain 1
MAGSRLIVVKVGDVEVEVEAVAASGTEATSGRAAKVAASALDAFDRAQDAIVEVAKSTAVMIEKAGAAARPDRVEVEFGLKFSASGGVIMAGVAGEATLKVTLGYDVAARPAGPPAAAPPESAADSGGTKGLRSESMPGEPGGPPAESS